MKSVKQLREDLEKKVKRGVAFLDQHEPGWREKISGFMLCDPYNCVLAQLSDTGCYSDYVDLYRNQMKEFCKTQDGFTRGRDIPAIFLGFSLSCSVPQTWNMFQKLWEDAHGG